MIYTNDESDKSVRQKNYYFNVYALPALVALIIGGIIFLLFLQGYVNKSDCYVLSMFAIAPATMLSAYKKRDWLRMPDDTFFYTKHLSQPNNVYLNEPTEYEAEYYYGLKSKLALLAFGLLFIGVSIYIGIMKPQTMVLPFAMMISGIVVAGLGIQKLLDKTAALKLAKKGIWTRKTGYVEWKNVSSTKIVQDTKGDSPSTILEIYLKGTVFAQAQQPDNRLDITHLKGSEYIEILIDSLISKQNEPEVSAS